MKKTFLLTKMLFFLAMLCVGQGMRAQTTVTYDFTSYSARTLSNSGTKAFNANSVNHNYASNFSEVHNRFAFQFAGTFSIETAGLYAQRTNGDHVGIMGLTSGDKVTINFSQGAIMVRGDITNWTANTSAWTAYTTGTEIPINAAGNLSFQAKTSCKISSIVITTNATESMTAPTIDSEANGSKRTVTITDGASSLLSPVTTYYTTDGTDPTTSSTQYTAPFDVDATCTVKAITISNSSAATASTVASQKIDMDAVDVPTAAITAVDGINRTVTFSCATVGATLYYSTDNGETYTEGTSLVISANTNIKVKATKGSSSAESENMAFEAGTEIVLNAPTWTKTGYSEGVSTVTLADDQSSKLLSPVSTIMYQINDGAEQTYSSAISVNDGETLKYWSVATGYTNSEVCSVVAIAPNTNETIISENYVGVVSSNNNLSLADGDGYRKIYYNEGADLVSENLLASNINSGNYYQMYRAGGLYASVGWNLAIPNLKAGDYVTLHGVYGNGAFSISGASNMTADLWNSTESSKYCYTVNADGDVTFTMGRYGYLTSITIQRAPVTYTINIADGIENGTIVADPTSAKAGDEVTVTATPAEGYELASVTVIGATSEEPVEITDGKFTMPADNVTVSATFQKKVIYIETDLTSQFSALTNWQNWTGATGYTDTRYCPAVAINDGTTKQVCEKYEGTCATTGDVFYQTVTGLAAGTYKIELYGGAAFTFGRGFGSMAFTGEIGTGDNWGTHVSETFTEGQHIDDNTGVKMYAETSNGTYDKEIPIYYAGNFPDGAATVTLDGVQVGANGEVKIGMSKTSQSTNWHVVQLKGVTAQVNAIDLHATTLASAQAALSAAENAVVVGEEKTALETAIANNSEVTALTSEAYKAAIEALQTATSAFTSAREAYVALASTKESLVGYAEKYVYASAEKAAAVTAAAEAVPTSAADATSKNANLIAALRAMVESHANAESVEGSEAITITNPSAEDGTNGWTTVKGEGSGGSIGVLENEPWTSADGSTAHKYFDGGDWGASAWDVSLTQNVKLGAGKYMLSAIGRASGDVTMSLFVGKNKTTMPSIGAVGGVFGRGWNISSVEFEVEKDSTVTIGVQGVTNVIHNWMSFSDFKLVLIESYAVRIAKDELLEAINEAKAIDTEDKDGAEELAAAITVAEGVYNNEEATLESVNTAKSDLEAAVAAFNATNAKYSKLTYTITGQSSMKATIKKGKTVLDIIPEEGWAVSELKVNGEDALDQLTDNQLVVTVDADATSVEVTFGWADAENMYEEDEVTGIANIAGEGIKVYAQDNQICVEGAAGKVVRVYTLNGSLLNAATPSENKVAKFSVVAGTYVVQVGNKAAKISVK